LTYADVDDKHVATSALVLRNKQIKQQ